MALQNLEQVPLHTTFRIAMSGKVCVRGDIHALIYRAGQPICLQPAACPCFCRIKSKSSFPMCRKHAETKPPGTQATPPQEPASWTLAYQARRALVGQDGGRPLYLYVAFGWLQLLAASCMGWKLSLATAIAVESTWRGHQYTWGFRFQGCLIAGLMPMISLLGFILGFLLLVETIIYR